MSKEQNIEIEIAKLAIMPPRSETLVYFFLVHNIFSDVRKTPTRKSLINRPNPY